MRFNGELFHANCFSLIVSDDSCDIEQLVHTITIYPNIASFPSFPSPKVDTAVSSQISSIVCLSVNTIISEHEEKVVTQ